MTLRVSTARVSYCGADRFDVTRGSGRGDGLAFAPSTTILAPALAARKLAEACLRKGAPRQAASIEDAAWAVYAPLYVAEMRAGYGKRDAPGPHREAWDRLLARERVVLVCFCDVEKWRGHCHRVLLARDILPKFPNVVYEGEIAERTLF